MQDIDFSLHLQFLEYLNFVYRTIIYNLNGLNDLYCSLVFCLTRNWSKGSSDQCNAVFNIRDISWAEPPFITKVSCISISYMIWDVLFFFWSKYDCIRKQSTILHEVQKTPAVRGTQVFFIFCEDKVCCILGSTQYAWDFFRFLITLSNYVWVFMGWSRLVLYAC